MEFQDLADTWSKGQISRSLKLAKYYWFKSKKLKNKLTQKDWKEEWVKFEDLFYANKAIMYNAEHNIPFHTLVLLGRLLSKDEFKDTAKTIIKDNVILCEDYYLKLDDPQNQLKIRKALRTYQFKDLGDKKTA